MNNENITQDHIDKALTELLESDLLNISVDDAGEFYYSLNEDGKKVAETILGINKIDPEVIETTIVRDVDFEDPPRPKWKDGDAFQIIETTVVRDVDFEDPNV